MANVTFDGYNKLIITNTGVTSLDVKVDLYSDWKEWVLLSDNSKYLPAFISLGGDPTVSGGSVGSTFFIINGWRIRPQEITHQLVVNGNLYEENGENPFIPTLGNYNVLITRIVSNIVDQVSTGSGLSQTQGSKLDEIHKASKLHTALLLD